MDGALIAVVSTILLLWPNLVDTPVNRDATQVEYHSKQTPKETSADSLLSSCSSVKYKTTVT